MKAEYDVVVVGGSLAGCTAAALLAQQGASVALVEKSPRADHYKVACTHFVHAPAVEVLDRLGVTDELQAAGAVRNSIEFWTRYGWVHPPADTPRGYDIRRAKLDPMVRRAAAATPGVDLLAGQAVTALRRDADGRPSGVVVGGRELRARLVVGADGRGSTVARLAGVPGRVRPHGRLGYFAHYEGARFDTGGRSRMWLAEPDVGYAFPNDDGMLLVAAFFHRDRAAEVKADPEAAVLGLLASLPDAPDLSAATRTSPWIGRVDLPNVRRRPAQPGLAFVGDAAQASDPLWGVGCAFAIRSGAWLADAVGPELRPRGDVDRGLARYRRQHTVQLAGHHWLMSDFATGRSINGLERMLYKGAARDEGVARDFNLIGLRGKPLHMSLTPAVVARAARAAMRAAPVA